jgi:hypothetical protein
MASGRTHQCFRNLWHSHVWRLPGRDLLIRSNTIDIKKLKTTWNKLGEIDPLWAVLTHPEKKGGRWDTSEFFETGVREVSDLIDHLAEVERSVGGKALDFGCGSLRR